MEQVWIDYSNWRGVRVWRRIIPERLWFGEVPWHSDPQWLLDAVDLDSAGSQRRTYAMRDIHKWQTIAPGQV